MSFDSLIQIYGYWAILIGTFLEGETILVLGGFVAHLGHLKLVWVIVAAFVGSFTGDQLFFYLGRRYSRPILGLLNKFPGGRARVERFHKLLDRYKTPVILAFRFFYGLRTVASFVIGTGSIRAIDFLILNAIGALVWASVIGTAGYLFGDALDAILGDVSHYGLEIMGAIAAGGVLIWIIYFYHRRIYRWFLPQKSGESQRPKTIH